MSASGPPPFGSTSGTAPAKSLAEAAQAFEQQAQEDAGVIVTMPQAGTVRWEASPDTRIAAGDILARIDVGGKAIELLAPVTGELEIVSEGPEAESGTVIARVRP